MRKTLVSWSVTLLGILLSVAVTLAQTECTAFVDQALSAVNTSCEGLGRNQACYGFNRVEAGFQSEVEDAFFTQPADITEVAMLETIRTVPLDLNANEWGVAVMVLQANLPETLPGQNVTFILMGDTEVENAVTADNTVQPSDGIEVEVTFPQGAAVRSGAGDNFNTILGVVVGTRFIADGISEDGNWLRVVAQDRPGWIRRTVIAPDAAIDALPILSDELYTPMQAFYLRTGIGQPSCSEVPDNSLLVQGPEDINIEITVNGANIELGSSGVLRMIEINGEPHMEIVVLDGQFVVKADEHNPQDVVILPGHRSVLCMSVDNNEGLDGEANDPLVSCGASIPERIDPNSFVDDWCKLENFPAGLLNYPLQTCTTTHTIAAGENLFRISQFYCVTIEDITSLNGIADAGQISVGQVLTIPAFACEGVGSTTPPPGVVAPPVSQPPTSDGEDTSDLTSVDCSNFVVPPQPVIASNFTLDWGDVPGANNYIVAVFDDENYEALTIPVSESFAYLNGGTFPSVGYVDVRAYQDGNYACYARMSFTRRGDPNPDDTNNPPPPPFTASLDNCFVSSITDATISWANAPVLPVVIFWEEGNFSTNSLNFNTASGTTTISEMFGFNFIDVSSGGQTISLGSC